MFYPDDYIKEMKTRRLHGGYSSTSHSYCRKCAKPLLKMRRDVGDMDGGDWDDFDLSVYCGRCLSKKIEQQEVENK